MSTAVAVAMAVVLFSTEEPRAHDVDPQPNHRDGNRFVKRYSHRVEEAFDRLVPD